MCAGLGLGIAFLIGLAFPNYWFLVAGLMAIGTALGPADQVDLDRDQEGLAGQVARQETRIAGV